MEQWRVARIAALSRFIMCGVQKLARWRLYLYKVYVCVCVCVCARAYVMNHPLYRVCGYA